MVQSPSWEANWFAASQEIPLISRNPKVHYRTHKHPPPVSILGQPNPVHIPTSHLLEINPDIIHQFTPRSPQWCLSLRFPHQDPIHSPLLTHTLNMPSPSHFSTPEINDQIHELILEDRRVSAKSVAEKLGITRERVVHHSWRFGHAEALREMCP